MDINILSLEEKIYITNINNTLQNKDEFLKFITYPTLNIIQKVLDRPRKTQLTGFFLFCSLFRQQIKTNNPGFTETQYAKICGVIWRALPTNTQNAYKNFLN